VFGRLILRELETAQRSDVADDEWRCNTDGTHRDDANSQQ